MNRRRALVSFVIGAVFFAGVTMVPGGKKEKEKPPTPEQVVKDLSTRLGKDIVNPRKAERVEFKMTIRSVWMTCDKMKEAEGKQPRVTPSPSPRCWR